MTVPPPVRHRFSGHPGQFRILPWKVCKVYTLSGFWSVGLPIGLALPRRPARFLFNLHARCHGCGTGGSARAGPFAARAHGVMHECIFFTQIVDTETFYSPKVFCTPSILFLQLRKMQNSLPPPRFRFLTRLTMSTSVVGHI